MDSLFRGGGGGGLKNCMEVCMLYKLKMNLTFFL